MPTSTTGVGMRSCRSSWSRWVLADDAVILNVDFIKDMAVFVVQYPDGVYLHTLDVTEGQRDIGADFVYRLDRRVSESDTVVAYDAASDRSTITLPYIP